MLQITQSYSTGFAFSVEAFQLQNIWLGHIDLSPSAAALLQDILKSNYKKQMSFAEKENRIFFTEIFITLMQGWSQDQQ